MAQKRYAETWSISVPRGHYETRELGPGRVTRTWVAETPTLENVQIDIDLVRVVHDLGIKAARSKSGKARALGGAIRVTHRRTK